MLGSTTTIYTRDTAWIDPGRATMESGELEGHAEELRLTVPLGAPARFPPSNWSRPNDLHFLLEHSQRPAVLRVRSIAGRSPPAEIEAREIERTPAGWLCTFDWWEIVRFSPLAGGGLIALEFDGEFEDGTAFVVDAAIDMEVHLQQ